LKALKYYFLDFRNKGIFYETVVNQILDDLVRVCQPRFMEVTGEFGVRGGLNSVVQARYDPAKRGVIK
jgi:7-cyano-7-deazaguanine reductase